ncbi:MAG: hypothetical protein OXD54_13725 [Candidatus Poribacteria bacterium]|nr:hypothetical protein [Candidatus Poribacteria bacterium]
MKIKAFWLPQLLAIVCILAVGSIPMVFADAHEAGEEMEMEEESSISGWFRTDTDSLGTQIWVGASHPVGSISIDSDIYVVDTFGEFDLGLGIPVVDSDSLSLSLLPMVGIGFDYATANGPTTLIAPQLFTYLSAGSIYFESWIQMFLNSPFDEEGADSFYTRDFVLYSINDTVAIGPQVEATIDLGDDGGLGSLIVGGRINLGYGENNTLGLFVGLETQLDDDSEDTGLTGRMTFVRSW